MIRRIEVAWAAGFFDGEGTTFCLVKQNRWRSLRMQIGQASRKILIRFRRAVGGRGKIYGPYTYRGSTPMWEWIAMSEADVRACLSLLWPHLDSAKRMQARAALRKVKI